MLWQWLLSLVKTAFLYNPLEDDNAPHLNWENGCVSHDEWLDLEGFAEGRCLVHGSHGCSLVCVDVLGQLLSETQTVGYRQPPEGSHL